MASKEELKNTFLARRESLSPESVLELGQAIAERFLKSPLFKQSENIGLYSPAKNEVETRLIFMKALEQGKNVYFPRVEQGIRFYEVADPLEMQKGAWGISEPNEHCKPLPEGSFLDVILVPGIAFDMRGYRVGYGKGFYDRFLQGCPSKTVGLAYDFQIVEAIPEEPWDQRVQSIFTEKREIQTA